MTNVLKIENLHLSFRGYTGTSKVLHGISLSIKKGERVALVGESGSGKSVTARVILGLLQELRTSKIKGALEFNGQNLNTMHSSDWQALRGTDMSMIFQDPTSSLNPVFTIGDQFVEVLRRRTPKLEIKAALVRAAELLVSVSINDHERVLNAFPFQLSGGMNQRVVIAMALANKPALLIADEPGTALDVTVQAQTLRLMQDLTEQSGTSVLFISHNLGVVREFADRVYVIYRGNIVESGPTKTIFEKPGHAYTQALMSAVPRLTGGGIPEIEDDRVAFLAPSVFHDEVGP
ncbi:ABC transporter ATP-binding protein [uncultured Maritalea sp.]|uniref:ABC transporter ATP-binding protein n=1 Tax=uncultured Maritalea sp. TaxID=757249 RepID=UPI00261EAB56|nr:ABC transporter ATP-binding protein [uncultured Maritalea sp.]